MKKKSEHSIAIADPFARRLMAQYLERRESDLVDLRKALADGDFEAIALSGHNLYGSGAAYGLEQVTLLGGSLEKAAKARATDRIASLIDALERFIRDLELV